MDKKLLKYRAEFDIAKANLYYLKRENEPFVEEGIVEIFDNYEKGYKVLTRLALNKSNSAIKSLILEESFTEEQNINDFHEYAKSELAWYLNRLKFIADEHSVVLDINGEVTDYKGNKHRYISMGLALAARSSTSLSLQKSSCMKVGQAKSSLDIDEYIDRYITISGFQDSVLRLISLATLYELIRDDLKNFGYTYTPNKNTVSEYEVIKQPTGIEISRIEILATSARNLVSHGNVHRKNTIEPLNKFWKLPLDTKHKFNRKDKKHVDLIGWASNRYSSVINALIECML